MQEFKTELTLKEAMEVAGVCKKTIYNWYTSGGFKVRHSVNRRIYIDKETFFAFINQKMAELNQVSSGVVSDQV